MSILDLLRAEFPRDAISWRAQSVSKKNPDNPKALALAYIDARDVMNRLDDICGPANWQDRYQETPKGRIICTLSIRIDGEWIEKSDGAGDTDVEGDKGALSDALKRAAVKWGVGRYLYDIESPWVPCKLYNDKWSEWADDPWKHVRNAPRQASAPPRSAESAKPRAEPETLKGKLAESEFRALQLLNDCNDLQRLAVWKEDNTPILDAADAAAQKVMREAYLARKKGLEAAALVTTP